MRIDGMLVLMIPILILAAALSTAISPAPDPAVDQEMVAIAKDVSPERIAATIQKLVSFHTRHTLSATDDPASGIGAARNWIKQEMESYAKDSGGRMTVEFDKFTPAPNARVPKPVEIMNVVATLKGTDPAAATRVYVVGGHYDSICNPMNDITCEAPGANDDASGTSVALECARVLSKHSFPSTIVFIAFVAEEQGLLGAKNFADNAKKQGWKVTMLNNDIVGGNKGGPGKPPNDWVRVFSEGPGAKETEAENRARQSGGGEVDTPSRQLARYVEDMQAMYVPGFPAKMIWRKDRFGRGGDHSPFAEVGYPAVRFCEAIEDFTRQHAKVVEEGGVRKGDLFEYVDPEYIANVARINAVTLASLADAPAPPENAKYMNQRGENSTIITWEASPDNAASYEIVWRDTTAPRWEHVIDAGKELKFRSTELSKDNYFFGVRAVDAKGHRSLVIFPKPPVRPQGAGAPPPVTDNF